MAYTLSLDKERWDLQLDASGRIATCTGAYAVAQNVANAVRLFTRDAWYAQGDGIPHFTVDISQRPNPELVRSYIDATARAVPEVASAFTTITSFTDRTLTGEITITTTQGDVVHVAL